MIYSSFVWIILYEDNTKQTMPKRIEQKNYYSDLILEMGKIKTPIQFYCGTESNIINKRNFGNQKKKKIV